MGRYQVGVYIQRNPRGDSAVTASTTPTGSQLQVNTAGSLGDTHRVQLSR